MDKAHVRCSLPKWYARMEPVTVASALLPLPADFVAYLHADGVVMPALRSEEEQEEQEEEQEDGGGSDDGSHIEAQAFPEVEARIGAAIAALGGAVFPKLNWSAPKDAVWVTFSGSLKCTSVHDVILLLKSSDRIGYDLDLARKDGVEPVLVLREWVDVHTALEVRAFVLGGRLVGISQRDHGSHFDFLNAGEIRTRTSDFFHAEIAHRMAPETDYVFDAYLQKNGPVVLIDINPADHALTNPLLFDWDALRAAASDDSDAEIEVRLQTEAAANNQPSQSMYDALPEDIKELDWEDFRKKMEG